MFRRFAVLLSFLAVLSFVMPEISPIHATDSYAQSQNVKPKRKNLLELLFGGAARKKKQRQKAKNAATSRAKVVKVRRNNSNQSARKAVTAAPAVVAVEKAEDASKILVVGDFMADQLAQGLERSFAQNPGLIIVNSAVGLSGMVRDDVRDWPGTINEMIDQEKPVAVIALVGMNDRQQLRTAEGKFAKLSDEWVKIYEKRTDKLARNVREKRVPMIWVGLPPVSRNKMNADYLRFNEIYRKTVETYGGEYVDVWDGFVDTEGRYFRSGPNVDGQIVTLRRSDGINMTGHGQDKLAFYVEKAVKKVTGFSKDALVSSLGSLSDYSTSSEPQYDPAGTGKTVVIALGGPAVDGGTVLEGDTDFLRASDAKQSVSFELVSKGLTAQPHKGRVDAGWGIPSFALAQDETAEPVLANMRGINLKAYLDGLPPLAEDKSLEKSLKKELEPVSN